VPAFWMYQGSANQNQKHRNQMKKVIKNSKKRGIVTTEYAIGLAGVAGTALAVFTQLEGLLAQTLTTVINAVDAAVTAIGM